MPKVKGLPVAESLHATSPRARLQTDRLHACAPFVSRIAHLHFPMAHPLCVTLASNHTATTQLTSQAAGRTQT